MAKVHIVEQRQPALSNHTHLGSGARAVSVLTSTCVSEVQEIVDAVRSACDAEFAAVSIRKDSIYDLAITSGLPPLEADARETFCWHTMDCHFTFEVTDAQSDARFSDSIYVNGEVLSVRSYASAPIYDANHEMVGRLCVFDSQPRVLTSAQSKVLSAFARNLSTILTLQEQAIDAQPLAEPEDQGAEILQMAAQISHDMRTQVAALQVNLEILDETGADDVEHERLLQAARRSADRLSSMIEGILDLNQIDRELHLTTVDVRKLVTQVISEVGPVLQGAQASVRINHLPQVRADAKQMYSLIQNLVSNAAKYTRPGVPPHIEFGSRRVGNAWEIWVRDNGVGVPEDKRTDIFKMLTQLDNSRRGNGIGLATVAQIVKAHDGDVGVRGNEAGPGSEFWFTIPDRSDSRPPAQSKDDTSITKR